MRSSGAINENIFHVDLNQYNLPHLCSAFILKTNNSIIMLDTGTSNDIPTLFNFFKEHGMSLRQVSYLVPSHYHFDHFGGGWKLWEEIHEKNHHIKILTTEMTKEYLQNPETHMNRAKRTYGNSIGEMKAIPDKAFEIITPNQEISIPGLTENQTFKLESTPGHTPDHVTPTLNNNDKAVFMNTGEAAGTLMHSSKLITLGTSMPPEFNFKSYMSSIKKLIKKQPACIGLGHFGAVIGDQFVMTLLKENQEFTNFFRRFVKEKYLEKKETKYIVEEFIKLELPKRVDSIYHGSGLLTNVIVALVYGQLIDLGLRKPK